MRPSLLAVLAVAAVLVLGSGCTMLGAAPDTTPLSDASGVFTGGGCWTFIVAGDSRGATTNLTTGISPYLETIAVAIAAEKPAFVVFSGDLVSGSLGDDEKPTTDAYRSQFENWMAAMSPVHDYKNGTGSPVYVVRGNHEANAEQQLEAYLATVAQGMPENGPHDETRLTYAFSYGGARFIGLDEYVAHDGKTKTVNETWLDQQLGASAEPIRFVFGHAPAYAVDAETPDKPDDLSAHPARRDRFWTSLADHCVTAYFCGHSHLYARGEALGVTQMIVGIGGAPHREFNASEVDPALHVVYPATDAVAHNETLGYLVVTVNPATGMVSGTERVMDPATGTVNDGDTFTLSAAACPPRPNGNRTPPA